MAKAKKKKWFESKTIWAGVIIGLIGVGQYVFGDIDPQLLNVIYALTGTLGIVGVRRALDPK